MALTLTVLHIYILTMMYVDLLTMMIMRHSINTSSVMCLEDKGCLCENAHTDYPIIDLTTEVFANRPLLDIDGRVYVHV
jgi:hypothetical protein